MLDYSQADGIVEGIANSSIAHLRGEKVLMHNRHLMAASDIRSSLREERVE